jgi:hypothetical protein
MSTEVAGAGGYTAYPSATEFEKKYGFKPGDEQCNLCPVPKREHFNMGHVFLPSGKSAYRS